MALVFISYFHDDFEFAENLKQRLEKAGFEVWMDEERLKAGEDWREEIDEAIKNSFVLLLVLTPKALTSKYVMYEWSFAWGADKKVIPLLLIEVDDKDLHPRLDKRQYLNFTSRNTRQWSKLVQRLKELEGTTIKNPKSRVEEKITPAIQRLLHDLKHTDVHTRIGAAKTLGQFSDSAVIDGLLDALRDKDSRVREQAAFSLAEREREEISFALLVNLHGDKDSRVRVAAAYSLGIQATHEAILGLIESILTDEDYSVREMAIERLEAFEWSADNGRYVSGLAEFLLDGMKYIERRQRLIKEGKNNPIVDALSFLDLKEVTANIDLCESVAQILNDIGTPEALAAVEEWRRRQQNPQ